MFLGNVTMEAVVAAALVTTIMYGLYHKGRQDGRKQGIREGIEHTVTSLEAEGLLSFDSDND